MVEQQRAEGGQRQLVKFDFYKIDPAWRRLPQEEREAAKQELLALVEGFSDFIIFRSYNLVGIRGDSDFLLWKVADRLEAFQSFGAQVNKSALGRYLTLPYSYLSQTRHSIYVAQHRHPGQEGTRAKVHPYGANYMFVYPFVKTREWYRLPKDVRQDMMNEHFRIGHQYPSVRINTTYSYGLDDQEFMLAFESESPSDFLDLVMELRESQASAYTLRDTPVFTCVAAELREILDGLG